MARCTALTGHGLTSAAVEMVRNGTVAAYMTQLTLLQYLVNQQPCDMAIVDQGWGYGEQVHLHVPVASHLKSHCACDTYTRPACAPSSAIWSVSSLAT